jgi:hypothetical protein
MESNCSIVFGFDCNLFIGNRVGPKIIGDSRPRAKQVPHPSRQQGKEVQILFFFGAQKRYKFYCSTLGTTFVDWTNSGMDHACVKLGVIYASVSYKFKNIIDY